MNKHTFVIIIILLIAVTSIFIPASAQSQESKSKINATIIMINSSNIKDALTSVLNNTSPHYVRLSEDQINDAIKDLPGWTIVDDKLHKTFTFVDFPTLFEFMYKVADSSQKLNHHPNMTSTWNTLTIDYDTWNLGHVISNFDVKAADIVEKLYQSSDYTDIRN